MPPKTRYLNATALHDRGWTAAMIRDFLGQPDATTPNPRFRRAAPTLLFAKSRVHAAERSAKFKRRLELAAHRSACAKAAAQRRREEVLRLVAAEEIVIPRLAPNVLTTRAVRHRDEREGEATDATAVDRATLDRWKVNYLRHELTSYDSLLDGLFGRVGRLQAEKLLRRRVYFAIGRTYSDLVDECQRQLRARESDCGP